MLTPIGFELLIKGLQPGLINGRVDKLRKLMLESRITSQRSTQTTAQVPAYPLIIASDNFCMVYICEMGLYKVMQRLDSVA
ncbi:5163_t:CDS:2 [Paraglomus occultum]|uniref:5163_t:CDS:1 n=1 Tax=Paraglomus occultum TaxID=144539 RepID=A0A9N9FW57_9GLOM|nr:5163_t:CDS:2 [Paraglomus occultum]